MAGSRPRRFGSPPFLRDIPIFPTLSRSSGSIGNPVQEKRKNPQGNGPGGEQPFFRSGLPKGAPGLLPGPLGDRESAPLGAGHRLPGRHLHDPNRKRSPCHGHSPEYDHQSTESRRLEIHCPGPRFLFQQVFPDLPLSRPLTRNVVSPNVFLHTRREEDLRLFAGSFFLFARHCPFGKRQSVKNSLRGTSFPGALGSEPSLSPDFDGNLLKSFSIFHEVYAIL